MNINIVGSIFILTSTLYIVPSMIYGFGQNEDDSNDTDLSRMVDQVNQFGMQFLNNTAMSPENQKNDVIFSSPSIFLVLSLLYKASRGETREEIGRVFFPDGSNDNVENDIKKMLLRIKQLSQKNVNLTTDTLALFNTDSNVNEVFLQMAEEYFEAKIYCLANMDLLKSKIKEFNRNLTKSSVVPEQRVEFFKVETPAEDIAGLLYNYIYFKAPWDEIFETNNTKDAEFLVKDSNFGHRQCATVPTMKQYGSKYPSFINEVVSILSIPFSGDNLVFYVVMPTQRVTTLGQVYKFLREYSWKNISKKMFRNQGGVNVHLPKFEIEADYNLQEELEQLGIKTAFTHGAQFTNIGNVKLSKATHKAFVKIDESGGEAGGKSIFMLAPQSLYSPEPLEFKVDRPFVFAIVDKSTGLALFQGVFRGQQFTTASCVFENDS